MVKDNQWYVITGGPSSGKSSLLKELNKMGHKTIEEVARTVIDEGIASGKLIDEIRADEKIFQDEVLKRKVEIERVLDKNVLTFFDRGIHDSLAYFRHYEYEVNEFAQEAIKTSKYAKVFLLDLLPNFAKDYARTEDKEFAKNITRLLYEAYAEAGMQPIRVPTMPPKKRAKFILRKVEQGKASDE